MNKWTGEDGSVTSALVPFASPEQQLVPSMIQLSTNTNANANAGAASESEKERRVVQVPPMPRSASLNSQTDALMGV